MSSQFKANKDQGTGEQILEDIHQDSKMPSTAWILAETICNNLNKQCLLAYFFISDEFNAINNKDKEKFLNLAKEILGEFNEHERQSRSAS